MDSFEMSVTNTDCQYPGCVYAASVYTYPYCHEHEELSPHYRRTASPVTKTPPHQHINDLNKGGKAKSASLSDELIESGEYSLTRQHSRSMEDTHQIPGYVHEVDFCRVPNCVLRGHPDQEFYCTQHFVEKQSRQQGSKGPERHYHKKEKEAPLPGKTKSSDGHGTLDTEGNANRSSVEAPGLVVLECKNSSCKGIGSEPFHGYCPQCYIKLDLGGDTEVIYQPEHRQNDIEAVDEKNDRNCPDDRTKEREEGQEQGNDDKQDDNLEFECFAPKPELQPADTQEFQKCRRHSCNRLAPPVGTSGLCADCFTKATNPSAGIIEPPSYKTVVVDHARSNHVHPAAPQHVRNVSLQSFPSLPIKQTYPSNNFLPVGSSNGKVAEPPTQTEISSALKCVIPGCTGIFVQLDGNKSGLCYKCLKSRRSSREESQNQGRQQQISGIGDTSPSSSDSSQFLRRLSGGRRSGRKRHTIAVAPSSSRAPRKSSVDPANHETGVPCFSPLCDKLGSQTWGGFCKDCFEWMCMKFEQFEANQPEEMKPCANKGCEYFGASKTKGYCSQCYRKHHTSGKEVTFGMERRFSSGRSITPPPGALGQMCANPYCNQYGHEDYCNFCPSCFKVFDRCTGISYSPPPIRSSFVPTNAAILDSESYIWTSPRDCVTPPAVPPRTFASGNARVGSSYTASSSCFPAQIASRIPPTAAHPTTAPSNPRDITARCKETLESVETASRVGKVKCRSPHCKSFGNSRCKGYCNSCYVKTQDSMFV